MIGMQLQGGIHALSVVYRQTGLIGGTTSADSPYGYLIANDFLEPPEFMGQANLMTRRDAV